SGFVRSRLCRVVELSPRTQAVKFQNSLRRVFLHVRFLPIFALVSTLAYGAVLIPQNPTQNPSPAPLNVPPASPTPTPIVLPSPTVKIDGYRTPAGRIIGAALTKNKAWERLEYLTDRIGNRLSGSPQLERAIAWAVRIMREDGLDNVRTEKVMVPHWVR